MNNIVNVIDRNPRKPFTIRLLLKIANQDFIISTLSINTNIEQLYYLIEWSADSNDYHVYLNTNEKTSPIKKISFHVDQTHIEITAFSGGKPRDFKLDVTEIEFLPKDNSIKLLMVESFYIESGKPLLSRPDNLKTNRKPFNPNIERLISNLPVPKNFSLIILLVPTSLKPEYLFCLPITIDGTSLLLADLKEEGHLIERIKAYREYDLVVFTTPYVPKIIFKSQKVPTGSIRVINYKKPVQSLIRIHIDNFKSDIAYIKIILGIAILLFLFFLYK